MRRLTLNELSNASGLKTKTYFVEPLKGDSFLSILSKQCYQNITKLSTNIVFEYWLNLTIYFPSTDIFIFV